MGSARIMIVDDDPGVLDALSELLGDEHEVVCVSSGAEGLRALRKKEYDLVFLDLVMPGLDGLETLRRIKNLDKTLDVVLISATDKARQATEAMRLGAFDYVTKPFDLGELLEVVEKVIDKRRMFRELSFYRSQAAMELKQFKIVTTSRSMLDILHLVEKAAPSPANVLILGESGTGKELIAKALHLKSPRHENNFVAINCAAIPSELLENELFGHEQGAFTGANKRQIGKLEYAHQGTLFLDEIGAMPLEPQAKLLRFLQEREINRVGGTKAIKLDVRVVAATNVPLEKLISQGRFREDLFFRLNVIPLSIPPLRKRREDIPVLIRHFVEKYGRSLNKEVGGFTQRAMEALSAYDWPGNVRELENIIERLVVLSPPGQYIDDNDLPLEIQLSELRGDSGGQSNSGCAKDYVLAKEALERRYIAIALQRCNGNRSEAARMLGLHRNTLINKLRALGIH